MKQSITIYKEPLAVLDKLSTEDAGKLFKAIYQYSKEGKYTTYGLWMDLIMDTIIPKMKVTKPKAKKEMPPDLYYDELQKESMLFSNWVIGQMPINLTEKQKVEARFTYMKLRSNGYSKDQVKEAIIYATTDEFWKMNFRVPSKLIKKDKEGTQYIDVFLLKAKAKVESQPKLKEYNPHVA